MVNYKTIDEYISLCPEPAKGILSSIRGLIQASVPEATEVISYGVPAFDLKGQHLLFFAAYKKHISIYPRSDAAEDVLPELKSRIKGRGTYQFPLDQTFPFDLIESLIPFMVADRS